MQVDITVNNILAIVNTKLLADYVKLDERLLQLCCIVKHWAKRRQVSLHCWHAWKAGQAPRLCDRSSLSY